MKTKKILLLGLVAASLLASCKKNNDNNTAAGLGFKAITENNNGDSRTYLDGVDVKWMEGDSIMVANASGEQQVFKLAGGASTMNGDFYDANVAEAFYTPDYVALYPAKNAAGVANTIDADGIAIFTLPSTQAITATGTFANKSMPMVAHSGTETLPFKNVLGGLVIPLVGDGLHVSKVVLTSLETTDKLWGVYTADCNSDDPVPAHVSGGNHQLTLSCDVTLDPATANDFIFMVPPGTLSKGFKVEVYDGTDFLYEKTADWSATPNATFIPRSVLMKVDHNLEVVPPTPVDLVVTTISPTFITTNSALGLGAVDNTPATCGILYALASDLATPADDLVIGGNNVTDLHSSAVTNETGIRFDASLTGLAEDQIYYVRAYATNEVGTVSYGDPVPFATRYDYYSAANMGKSRSVFTVDANNTRVRFSMGNLQYIGSAGSGSADDNNTGAYWKFADNQFDYFGSNGQGSAAIQQDRDLFGWGTSGINDYTPIATCWQPWSTSTTDSQNQDSYYYPYGAAIINLNSNSGKADWGYNAISNGGNTQNSGWRTLQNGTYGGNTAEWNYLLNTRTCGYHRYALVQLTLKGTSGMRYKTVNLVPACGTTVNGLIVFPDSYTWPAIVNALTRLDASSSCDVNKLTEAQWSLLEQQGAVFLPGAGYRRGTSVSHPGNFGYYWTSTCPGNSLACSLDFFPSFVSPSSGTHRYAGFSVRLVCPAE